MVLRKKKLDLCIVFSIAFLAFGCQEHAKNDTSVQVSDETPEVIAEISALPPLPTWAKQPLPDFSKYKDTKEKKAAFLNFLYPRIVLANVRVLLERNNLAVIANKSELTPEELAWVESQAKRLKVSEDTDLKEAIALIYRRLDIIPPSLIMAQAANESGWGTSRFAKQGNNLFGQWCFSKGCGLVPSSRQQNKRHEVAKFSAPYFSVRSYIQNLNRHDKYQPLRELRVQINAKGDYSNGIDIVDGLLGYSERGEDYIDEIQGMINFNKLDTYDERFLNLLDDLSSSTLLKLATIEDPKSY